VRRFDVTSIIFNFVSKAAPAQLSPGRVRLQRLKRLLRASAIAGRRRARGQRGDQFRRTSNQSPLPPAAIAQNSPRAVRPAPAQVTIGRSQELCEGFIVSSINRISNPMNLDSPSARYDVTQAVRGAGCALVNTSMNNESGVGAGVRSLMRRGDTIGSRMHALQSQQC